MSLRRKILSFIVLAIFLFRPIEIFAQNHRYGRYDGPLDGNLGLQCILYGGVAWAIGMLIGLLLKKRDDNVVKEGQNFIVGIVGILIVGGGLIVALGFIMLGF